MDKLIIAALGWTLIMSAFGLTKVFEKAGKEPWEALIPFYNYFVLLEISGWTKYAVIFPILIPFVLWDLAKRFDKGVLFKITMLFPPTALISLLVLAYDKSVYNRNYLKPIKLLTTIENEVLNNAILLSKRDLTYSNIIDIEIQDEIAAILITNYNIDLSTYNLTKKSNMRIHEFAKKIFDLTIY